MSDIDDFLANDYDRVSIDRAVQPEATRAAAPGALLIDDGATIVVDMVALECILEVGQGDLIEQQTVSAAREQSQAAPEFVQFLNQFGSYTMSCASAAAYSSAFDAITVRGERGEPWDARAVFDPPRPATDTPQEMADAVAGFVEGRDDAFGRGSSIGLPAPSGDPVSFLVDSYHDLGALDGETNTITLGETDGGWVIVDATVRRLCTRGPGAQTSESGCD